MWYHVYKCKSGHTPDLDRRIVRSEARLKRAALDFAAFIISSCVIKQRHDDDIDGDTIGRDCIIMMRDVCWHKREINANLFNQVSTAAETALRTNVSHNTDKYRHNYNVVKQSHSLKITCK